MNGRREGIERGYGDFFNQVSAALFAADPIGINLGSNTDEYDPEAGTIIPRLRECRSADEVQKVVHEEFIRWFANSAGPEQRYEQVAIEIWRLWQEFTNR